MKYPNLDWSEDLSPADAHVAAVWPLEDGDQVTFHQDECPAYDGDRCRCKPITCRGPTAFA